MAVIKIVNQDPRIPADVDAAEIGFLDGVTSDIQAQLDSKVDLQDVYPVGSIYIETTGTNPGTTFGFGTWAAFAAGRTLVGLDAGQTEFDTVEETGGAKTHTLTVAEMPSHAHSIDAHDDGTGGGSTTNRRFITSGGTSDYNTFNTGGGGAHNNLQPYIVVYMWKRTA